MNALNVLLCIPFLLMLADYSHAHGFTTFGKTPSNHQTQPPPPAVPAKQCNNHSDCSSIPETSCVSEPHDTLKKSCLCGDNKPPQNGQCKHKMKGPNHQCSKDTDQCVEGASCVTGPDFNKVCKCMEGYTAIDAECSHAGHIGGNTLMALLLIAICRTLF